MKKINYDLDEQVKLPDVARETLDMGRADQEAIGIDDGSIDELSKLHTTRVKKIIDEFGYPVTSLVGKKASHWAWLLIQHSDHDIGFQEMCLKLMKSAPADEVAKSNIAYLEDRVRKNKGQSQIYGTQFVKKGKILELWPVEDIKNLDTKRKKMGLNSFEEYKKDFYGEN
ncbi:MAG: hypothetical protein G01um101416_138 [Microgenomates group bacterium Gr01-1014_16]|nr:MAG: hypothetical protein G01um101416_138 [Microgenomates group bacterium Gr01-1014_16]